MRRYRVFAVTGSYKRVNYTDIETTSGAMRPLTDSLDSEQVGVSIARCEPGWRIDILLRV